MGNKSINYRNETLAIEFSQMHKLVNLSLQLCKCISFWLLHFRILTQCFLVELLLFSINLCFSNHNTYILFH